VVHIDNGTAIGNIFFMMVCTWQMMSSCPIFLWIDHVSCNWTGWLKMMKCFWKDRQAIINGAHHGVAEVFR